jgi:hypothetical protein
MDLASTMAAALVSTALALSPATALADAPCDGAYRSWGRACFGGAFVRDKTIEWNSSFSTCKPSPYEVLDSVLEGKPRSVAYRIKKPSKDCRYAVIEIVEDSGDGEGWSIAGFTSMEAYGRGEVGMACPVEPMPSKRCNLEFARKTK